VLQINKPIKVTSFSWRLHSLFSALLLSTPWNQNGMAKMPFEGYRNGVKKGCRTLRLWMRYAYAMLSAWKQFLWNLQFIARNTDSLWVHFLSVALLLFLQLLLVLPDIYYSLGIKSFLCLLSCCWYFRGCGWNNFRNCL